MPAASSLPVDTPATVPADPPARQRSPKLGYALAALAATMWAVNGSLAKFLIDDGVSPWHLSEMRSLLSFVLLAGFLALTNPRQLKIPRQDVKQLALYGIAGLALVHATYFAAIERLDIGVALVIQYLGPLLILIWLRVFHGRHLSPSLWAAMALSLAGSFFVVQAYEASSLDGLGLLAAAGAAVTFAFAMVSAERAGQRHAPATTLAYGFGFAALFWLIVRPPWTFPFDAFDSLDNLLYGLGVSIVGTLIPFILIVTAVRHIPASRAAVIATLEPILAALIAWPIHDQALALPQILGGVVVVAAVIWVQSHRPQLDVESAP